MSTLDADEGPPAAPALSAFGRIFTTWRRLRERRAFRWALDIALVLAVFSAISLWQGRNALQGAAPSFVLQTLQGSRVTSESLRGKPAVLVFWAPWCGVCRAESGNVARVASFVGDRAQVLSVASDYDNIEAIRAYVERHDVDYPVLLGGNATARDFKVRAFPTHYFLDEDGNIRHAVTGYTSTFGLWWRLFF